ncbi:MAG: LacI family transcriptional regulator [Propionibacteriaceae bacterium]|jgi:DNA-binding LacI/PurR family transcriptional regulator|nr:LacI family transcriptional regulator [Propionibacteriaceae bacterium]
MTRRSVGLIDIATAAGVSRSTASRALRGEDRVSSDTVEKVRRAAESLGYVRDLRASDLASNQASAIGIMLRASERSFYGEIAARIQTVVGQQGLDLIIVNGGDSRDTQMRAISSLLGHKVAGVIIASGRASMEVAQYAASFAPVVLVGLSCSSSDIDSTVIDPDSERALARAVLSYGHRTVAVTSAAADVSRTLYDRAEVFSSELRDGGATVVDIGEAHQGGAQLAQAVTTAIKAHATAIMTGDDPTMLSVLEELQRRRISWPDQVSVTGFDGVGVFASPLLGFTTMRQPVEDLGQTAIRLVMTRIADSSAAARHLYLPGRLLPGRTLGPVPSLD